LFGASEKKANGVESKICRVSFGSSFEMPCETIKLTNKQVTWKTTRRIENFQALLLGDHIVGEEH
jgi:hypothetical protein